MAVRIKYLKIFLDLVETRSFTLAAQKNGLTEPAVSRQLQALECEFKSRLAKRTQYTFHLTPAGEILREYAQKIVQANDKFRSQWEKTAQVNANTIRVATTPYIGLYSLPPCLKQFQAEHSHTSIHVEYHRAGQICEDVMDGRADLGLVAHRIKEPELEFILFRKELLVLICHPQHPFARKKTIRLAAFKGQTFISFEQGFPGFSELETILKRCRVKRRQIIEFNEIEPIKRAVAIGVGVAIVPEVTVRREVADQTLAALSIADGDFYHPLVAVCNRRQVCTPVLKQFIVLLKAAPKPMPVGAFSSASRLSSSSAIVAIHEVRD